MCAALSAMAWPSANRSGFSGSSLYVLAIVLSSFLIVGASSSDGASTLTQDAVNNLKAAKEALQNTGDEVAQKALMRRATEENLDAEDDSDDDEDVEDDESDSLEAPQDANEDLESSLVEKTSTRKCTRTGAVCRRRRQNLCSRDNCGASAKSFYRQPKSTYHCVHCRNMIHMITRKYARAMKKMGFSSSSLISRGGGNVQSAVDDAGGSKLLSVEEMEQMPSEALTQLIEDGEGALCTFKNSFQGCALQKRLLAGPKFYRCGKCWRSKWYPKKAPNVYNPYDMKGPPGPPGPPGPRARRSRSKGKRGDRHRRRRRAKSRRRRRRRRKSSRKKRSSLLSASEEGESTDPSISGLNQELGEGFSEAS